MEKRKLLALVLVLVMVGSMFTACGRSTPGNGGNDTGSTVKDKESADSNADSGNDAAASEKATPEKSGDAGSGDGSSASSGPIKYEKGQELSAFVGAYMEAKSATMDKLTAKIDESTDLNLTMSLLGFAMMDLTVAFVPMFDAVDKTGFIPILNIKNAFRKEKGNLVTFGADYKVEEESGNNQKNDRIFWDGKLDTNDDSLSTTYYTERAGKKIEQTVMEITKNKDGSYTSETISYNANEDGTGKISGNFISFEGEDIWLQMGVQENGKPDFNYTTVFNKKNVDIKDLSKGFTLTTDLTYIKGVITNNIKE